MGTKPTARTESFASLAHGWLARWAPNASAFDRAVLDLAREWEEMYTTGREDEQDAAKQPTYKVGDHVVVNNETGETAEVVETVVYQNIRLRFKAGHFSTFNPSWTYQPAPPGEKT